MNQKGFSILEGVIASAILAICVSTAAWFISDYFRMTSRIHHEQQLYAQADALLSAFKSKKFCHEQLGKIWSGFPATPYLAEDSLFSFSKINLGEVEVALPDAPFPKLTLAILNGVHLNLESPPIVEDQLVVRATITASFSAAKKPIIRKRTTSIFLRLDGQRRVVSCMDTKDYAELDWMQEVCRRLDGSFQPDATCNLSESAMIKKKICHYLGKTFNGGVCNEP